jgi:hypothetical protein
MEGRCGCNKGNMDKIVGSSVIIVTELQDGLLDSVPIMDKMLFFLL